jgi:hypothetical protein
MNEQRVRRLVGLGLILGALLINVPYFILIATFDYPSILREPTAAILTRFQAGGPILILTWLAFAWIGLPLLFASEEVFVSALLRTFGLCKIKRLATVPLERHWQGCQASKDRASTPCKRLCSYLQVGHAT